MLVALASVRLVQAQLPGKIPWIGYLAGAGSGPSPAFIQGLGDLGYVEGKNIGIIYRTTEGRSERSADLAAELVRLKVDIIVADGTGLALAVKKATTSIPIVVAFSTDPVGTGLVASVARPGGNVTGLTTLSEELGGKQLELLKEIVAGLDRVAILAPTGPIPVSRSTWWQGVKTGRYPKPVKLGPRITAWRVEDIRVLIERGAHDVSDDRAGR